MTKRHSRSRRSKDTPGWMWMLLGLTIGLVVAGYVYVGDLHAPSMAAGRQTGTSESTRESRQQAAPASVKAPAGAQAAGPPASTSQASTARASAAQASPRQTATPPTSKTQNSTAQNSTAQNSTAQASTAQPRTTEPPAAEPQAAAQSVGVRFQFYENLPQSEVVVPGATSAAPAGRPAATPTAATERSPAAQTAARASVPPAIEEPGSYMLQVGSFRTHADADRRKASIALLGYESEIRQATVNGDLVHRVLVGPITDLAALDVARRRFHDQNFDTLVLKAGK